MDRRGKRGNNEGSVYHRADGRWVGALTLPGGRRKSFYGQSQKAVLDRLAKAREELQRGRAPVGGRLTVGTYLTRWLEDTAQPGLRVSTFRSYSDIIKLHLLPALGTIPLTRLTREDVQSLLRRKQAAGKSPRTVRNIRAVLRHALNQAIMDGHLALNAAAAATPPRVPHYDVKPLTPEEARKLLETAKGDRLEALYALVLTLGLRRGEGLGLRWADIDLEQRQLRVTQALTQVAGRMSLGEPKTTRSRRTLPLTPGLVGLLKAHRARQLEDRLRAGPRWQNSGLVFTSTNGGPTHPRNALRSFYAMLERGRLPRMRLHDLRHSAASFLLASGVSPRVAMDVLGHSQIAVTMDLYSHLLPGALEDAVGKADSLMRGT